MVCTAGYHRGLVLACVLATPCVSSLAGEPNPYVRKPTWAETMLASRKALLTAKDGSTFKPFVSGVIRGAQAAQRVSLDVSGIETLWLVVTIGPDTYNYDQSIWAEPTLIGADGKATDLTKLKPESVKVGWGRLLHHRDQRGKPLQIGRRVFKRGFWAHAPSALSFRLDGKYKRFEAWVGIGIAAGKNGSVQFRALDRLDAAEGAWRQIENDFPTQANRMRQDAASAGGHLAWFTKRDSVKLEIAMTVGALDEIGPASKDLRTGLDALRASKTSPDDARWLTLYAKAAVVRDRYRQARALLKKANLKSLRLAIQDLARAFPKRYPKGEQYLGRLDALEKGLSGLEDALARGDASVLERVDQILTLRREALLANPLLDFDKLLVVRRSVKSPRLGLPANWQGNCSLPSTGYDNEIALLSPVNPEGKLRMLYKPEGAKFVGDVDLHFDADRMLFSMPGTHGRWQIWEIRVDGRGLRQVTPGEEKDVDNYDACYLPDGRIMFGSTAPMHAVPCVYGSSYVANLFRMDPDGGKMRQLCFDQDHNWCPTMLHNGRVLYTRWEYTDTPHSNTRLLFHMNPDGTGQMEYYGSNSYWPNGVFYARPIPGHPTQVVGIVTGHHGVARMGEMVIFDPARGRQEAKGAIQRIGQYGKRVERVVADRLVDNSWPKFLHPYPLSDKYFLVSCKPTPQSLWGVYLVDVFDNMVLLKEQAGDVLFEPVPLRKTPRPPVVPDRVDLKRKDAVVYLTDIYTGGGLDGVPRGTVRKLRLFTYVYGYRGMGGLLGVIGMDGPWDIKRVLGTVPVQEDGSALFRVPANTPISVQPLDAEGKALQLMRSWFTAMPGETLSCVGCHERQNMTPPVKTNVAAYGTPSKITPWRGPTRGFAFHREVQPVLDRYCVGCHNGQKRADGKAIADLRGTKHITDWKSVCPGNGGGHAGKRFSVAYATLHRYVRRPGIESDYHMLTPMEYHADTTELVQMLAKGHNGVTLDAEAWDRLITWIDLNTPYHGTWTEIEDPKRVKAIADRSREMRKRYAGVDVDYEAIPPAPKRKITSIVPKPVRTAAAHVTCPGWPFDAKEARRRQAEAGKPTLAIDLGGVKLDLMRIPAGEFVMGDLAGHPDEGPLTRVRIERPFWMGKFEVTNEQFARFDPSHDSRVESKRFYQFGVHGYPVNKPRQPVVRVSWTRAMAFCRWLSDKTGLMVSLPTEAQWEYACRAGTSTAFSYGGRDADFSGFANVSDAKIQALADNPYLLYVPLKNPTKYDDWVPRDARFNDGAFVSEQVGKYQPNAWGLHEMHGNVAEWTRTVFSSYPYNADDGRSDPATPGKKVVRGGSWYDRPKRARSAFRLAYRPYQRVYNVGFRVVCEDRRVGRAHAPDRVAHTASLITHGAR